MMRIHLSLNSWYFLTPPSSNPWSSLKKDEINLLDLSLWGELLLAAGSCRVPIKTEFHSKVTQVSCWRHRISLRVRHDPARSPTSLLQTIVLWTEVGRTLAAEMSLLGRSGSARISRRWIFHVVLDALLMHRVRKGCRTQTTWAGLPARAPTCY